MEISNLVYKYVVILSTGSHHYLTEKKHEQLKEASLDDLIELENGNSFKVSASMDILTIENYKQQFPEKNVNYGQPFEPLPNFEDFRSEKLSRNGLESMIVGIKRAVTEFRSDGKEPLKCLELLAKAEKALKLKSVGN